MIAYERGPFKLFERMRTAIGIFHFDDGAPDHDLATREIQKLVLCVWCLSQWLAAAWLAGWVWLNEATMIASYILALSAGAIIAERINRG